jgi:hypothetical protein
LLAISQVWLESININTIPRQGFCLHYISDYQGTTGKAFVDQYTSTRGVLVEKMQTAEQYCGNMCILGSSLEPRKPQVVSFKLSSSAACCSLYDG